MVNNYNNHNHKEHSNQQFATNVQLGISEAKTTIGNHQLQNKNMAKAACADGQWFIKRKMLHWGQQYRIGGANQSTLENS